MKIIVIIQARMGSTRLPGKIVMPLNGKPLISHLIDNFQKMTEIDDVVIATSVEKENDSFIEYLNKYNASYFRGDENDVLSRFVNIIESFQPDIVVRVTADDPLMSEDLLRIMLRSHISEGADYTFMKGLPIGISPEIVNANILIDIYNNKHLSPSDREHVTIYIKEHANDYKINYMQAEGDLNHPELSLTVDTKEEYFLMKDLFDIFGDDISLEKVMMHLIQQKD